MPGCLEEFDDAMTGPGRPAKRLRLSRENSLVVGVTVDVRSCEVAAAGFDGVVREETQANIPHTAELREAAGGHRRAREVASLRRSADPVHRHQRRRPRRLSSAGNSLGRQLAFSRRQETWPRFEPASRCRLRAGSRCARPLPGRVRVRRSKQSGQLRRVRYVHRHRLGRDGQSFVSTGHSGFAGEMGHIPIVPNGRQCHCGRRGCLETVASEWALLERISERFERPIDFDEVMALALKGDKMVRSELNRLCKYLAIAIAHVVNLFDPQCIFVTGRLFDELPWLRDHLVARARQVALEPAFADCQFMPTSGTHLLGAVATAISAVTPARVHELKDTLNGITFSVTQRSVV